jgi:hypothetical protein
MKVRVANRAGMGFVKPPFFLCPLACYGGLYQTAFELTHFRSDTNEGRL